jgi:hypothetical protein
MVERLTATERADAVALLEAAPARLREALAGLSKAQLDTPYREGGWTVRQIAHHLPDSHLNAHVRLRLALTLAQLVVLYGWHSRPHVAHVTALREREGW